MKYVAPALLIINAAIMDQSLAAPPTNVTVSSGGFAAANGDALWGLTDCTVVGGGSVISCPAPAAYSMPSAGSAVVIVDDAGTSAGSAGEPRIPYIGSVASVSGGGSSELLITVSSSTAHPYLPTYSNAGTVANHVALVEVVAGGSAYTFGSVQTLNCSSAGSAALCSTNDGHVDGLAQPGIMEFRVGTASLVTHGSGGTPGPCTFTFASQTALPGQGTEFSATVTSTGTLVGPLTLIQQGSILNDQATQTSGTYTDPVAGCGFTTAPTISLEYTVLEERFEMGTGIYKGLPPCNNGTADGTTTMVGGSGSGLTLTCSASVETFPGTTAVGTDNTAALQAFLGVRGSAASGSMNAGAAKGFPECLYFPAGNYLTQPLNQYTSVANQASGSYLAQGYGCWLGDEHNHSNILVEPNVQGDVFAWVDSNQGSSITQLGNTQTFQDFRSSGLGNANQGGSSFRNLTIIGDRLSTAVQNGLAFYGPTQWAYIDNIIVDFMLGRALYAGSADASSVGNFNESVVQNVRFEDDGINQSVTGTLTTAPSFEITAAGTDGANTDSLVNIRIFQSLGTGLWIHNFGTNNARFFRLSNVFIEGSKVSGTTAGGDLLEIGDPSASGTNVTEVLGRNIQLDNPVIGYSALRITGDRASDTKGIDIDGSILGNLTNDPGRGLQVETCEQCTFRMAENNSTADYSFVVGSNHFNSTTDVATECSGSTIAAPGIIYDGEGGQSSSGFQSCIDTAAAGFVSSPVTQILGSTTEVNSPSNPLGDLDANLAITSGTTITMSSSGDLPINQAEPTWTLIRSGPTAAFTDNWDTTFDIINALGTATALSGQLYHMRVCNTSAYPEVIAPGTLSGTSTNGLTLGTVTVGAGTCLPITMTINNTSTITFTAGPSTAG